MRVEGGGGGSFQCSVFGFQQGPDYGIPADWAEGRDGTLIYGKRSRHGK